MKDNVRFNHVGTGAIITVRCGAFQLSKSYPTMKAACQEAVRLGIVSPRQQIQLEGDSIMFPLGLSTHVDELNSAELFGIGFSLSTG